MPSNILAGKKRIIRIRVSNSGTSWDFTNYKAEDIYATIADLKPDVLHRFPHGPVDPNASVVPLRAGGTTTWGMFLQACVNAGAPGCVMTPRLDLTDYTTLGPSGFFAEAQSLFSFPINPSFQVLSLDNWGPFSTSHTPAVVQSTLQTLLNQGWPELSVNESGGYHPSYGLAGDAQFNSSTNTLQPDLNVLQAARAGDPSIQTFQGIIDFPGTMRSFLALSTAQQEAMLTNIAKGQAANGYVMLYNILQGFWDAKAAPTTVTGQSMYDLMKSLLNQYNGGAPIPTTIAVSAKPH